MLRERKRYVKIDFIQSKTCVLSVDGEIFLAKIQDIFEEYQVLRQTGLEAKESLRRLKPYVVDLSAETKAELANMIRAYEASHQEPAQAEEPKPTSKSALTDSQPRKPASLKSLKTLKEQPPANPPMLACPQCGKPNRLNELLCTYCGNILSAPPTEGATKRLTIDESPSKGAQYLPHNTLRLHVRHVKQFLSVRPQDSDHELVIGRADAKGVVVPDIDLEPFGASSMGVSRMHLSLFYDRMKQHIVLADMGSVNGVFVNGQKMLLQEVRVLRHGDQLRLGDIVLDVLYI